MQSSSLWQAVMRDKAFILFATALGLYGLFSSPTPDNPGWIEAVIAALLISAVGVVSIYKSVLIPAVQKVPKWQLAAWVFFIYGLVVSSITAAVQGYSLSLIFRDMAGFVFLCLPLFVLPFLSKSSLRVAGIFVLALFIGVMFSLRVLFLDLGEAPSSVELLYLANSPLVLCAAIFFTLTAFQKLYRGISAQNILLSLLCAGIAGLIFAAMFIDLQRASFIAVAISLLAVFGIALVKAPLKTIWPVLFFLILAGTLGTLAGDVIENIALKTARVGFNMRQQELYAVWDVVTASWSGFFFGQGWGSAFASPAVGGLHVTYTHSLLSYILFKAGFIGLVLCLIYLFLVFEKLARLYLTDPLKGSALMWPFLIPIFLYASHKSFDFGLILSLILVQGIALQRSKGMSA